MTGKREDITLYTDDAERFEAAKERVEEDLGTSLSRAQTVSVLISHSEYGSDEAQP